MTRRSTAHRIDRNQDGCIGFDAALEAYLEGRDPSLPAGKNAEDLLRAASMVIGSTVTLERERGEAIAELTGTHRELEDYDDAGRAIRRWFALMWEPGARH